MNTKKLRKWTDWFFIAGAILVKIPYTLLITSEGISTSSLQNRSQYVSYSINYYVVKIKPQMAIICNL